MEYDIFHLYTTISGILPFLLPEKKRHTLQAVHLMSDFQRARIYPVFIEMRNSSLDFVFIIRSLRNSIASIGVISAR